MLLLNISKSKSYKYTKSRLKKPLFCKCCKSQGSHALNQTLFYRLLDSKWDYSSQNEHHAVL